MISCLVNRKDEILTDLYRPQRNFVISHRSLDFVPTKTILTSSCISAIAPRVSGEMFCMSIEDHKSDLSGAKVSITS